MYATIGLMNVLCSVCKKIYNLCNTFTYVMNKTCDMFFIFYMMINFDNKYMIILYIVRFVSKLLITTF